MPEFIQVVEYQTTDFDGVRQLVNSRDYEKDTPRPVSVTVVQDRDRSGTYAAILRFSSYEDAMKHSDAESTKALAGQMAELMTGEPRFYNLDVIEDARP